MIIEMQTVRNEINENSDGYIPINSSFRTSSTTSDITNSSSEVIRCIMVTLYILLVINLVSMVIIGIKLIIDKCETCELYNRFLAMTILMKTFIHTIVNIIKIKKNDVIKNNRILKKLFRSLSNFFRFLSFILTTISFYYLNYNKNICKVQSFSLKIIRYYYFSMITIYFFPIFLYLFIGLFVSIIVFIMVNFSVQKSDRIPTPKNIINKLEKRKYKDLDYINKSPNSLKKKKIIKTPPLSMIYEKMKNAIREKKNINNEKILNTNSLKTKQLSINNENNFNSSDKLLSNKLNDDFIDQNEDMCSICMTNYNDNDDLLILPCDKRHFFHCDCVSKWLNKSQACPICRRNIVNYFNEDNIV